jgi:hypothetical protein
MKGLAIASIVILGIFFLGFLSNIMMGEADAWQILAMVMLTPVLVFPCVYLGRNK